MPLVVSGRWVALALLAGGSTAMAAAPPAGPSFVKGDVVVTVYPKGGGNDLLTGGLGAARLADPTPVIPNPVDAASLRTAAIYNNYRAIVDTSAGNGFGRLYGPLVAPTTADAEGKIYGTEYMAFAAGRQNVTLLVQIPDAFDPARACIVTGPSSGSRGIYGAIGSSGEWGLKHGCAVAYTDKGTGIGAHNLVADSVGLMQGERATADSAGAKSTFTAELTDAQRARFNARLPDRWAVKHAHSRQNPEADWGEHVVLSIRFALWALDHRLGAGRSGGPPPFTAANTLVIASSVSNGGGASLRAGEVAPRGMIDGIVVTEPNVNPKPDRRFVIQQGAGLPLRGHSRPLYDYLTLIDLFQGCANLATANSGAPLNLTPAVLGQNRCASLARARLLSPGTLAQQAAQAQRIINRYGILDAQNAVAPAYWSSFVVQAVAVTYANAYARASVRDSLCGFSFAATDGLATSPTFDHVVPLAPAAEAILFATANGIPPTGGLSVVNDRSPGGALRDQFSLSPSTGLLDQNLDGHRCLRALATGQRAGVPLAGNALAQFRQVQESIGQIRATGRLGGIPTLVVHGRSDALIAPNHTSRPYYALSRLADGVRSKIAYIEVTNAHHLDIFNAFPGFDARFVPLHHYFVQAMDRMYAHLTAGGRLPPSQLVRTVPRGTAADGSVPPIELANLPAIAASPASADRILFDGKVLRIPD